MTRFLRSLAGPCLGKDLAQLRARITRELFPPWLYRSNEMIVIRLDADAVRPMPRPLPEIQIRLATPDDEPLLQKIRPRARNYRRHLTDEGAIGVIGFVGGEPASYNFFKPGEWHVSLPNGYRFHVGEHAAWAFGMEVNPKFRLSGIFHKHWAEATRLVQQRGIDRFYGSVQGDNPLSVNSHRRLGFIPLYRFRVKRIIGLTWHEARPSEGHLLLRPSRGFGAWVGEDNG